MNRTKEKAILFNTEMAKAILDGRKTQTRRVVPYDISSNMDVCIQGSEGYPSIENEDGEHIEVKKLGKYKVGDTLYVRETFKTFGNVTMDNEVGVRYKADNEEVVYNLERGSEHTFEYFFDDKWRPSIHMPKKYARIFMRVTNIRVERLQDIEHEDILSEGMDFNTYEMKEKGKLYGNDTHGEADFCEDLADEWWQNLWDSTAPDGYKWENNPYVFVYEFEKIGGVAC